MYSIKYYIKIFMCGGIKRNITLTSLATTMMTLLNHVANWRNWMKLGSGMFTISICTVMLGDAVPKMIFGYSTSEALKYIVQTGFYTAIVFFLVSFVALAWHQSQYEK